VVDPVVAFTADLNRRFPGTYSSDVRLFLRWWQRPLMDVQRADIDQFIVWQQTLGRARATINRRLVALRMWFEFQAEQGGQPTRCSASQSGAPTAALSLAATAMSYVLVGVVAHSPGIGESGFEHGTVGVIASTAGTSIATPPYSTMPAEDE